METEVVSFNRKTEMVSLGDTVSTYFNRHGGGGVLGKLRSELRKES